MTTQKRGKTQFTSIPFSSNENTLHSPEPNISTQIAWLMQLPLPFRPCALEKRNVRRYEPLISPSRCLFLPRILTLASRIQCQRMNCTQPQARSVES